MRRTIATVLLTGFLFSAVPFASVGSQGPGDDYTPARIIRAVKKFLSHLIAVPTDDGDNMGVPKP